MRPPTATAMAVESGPSERWMCIRSSASAIWRSKAWNRSPAAFGFMRISAAAAAP